MDDDTTAIETAPPASINRILVALDATAESLTALNAAADLAAQLHAELLGLFVEDINLVRLADLPVGREIDLTAGNVTDIDHLRVERQFKIQKAKAQTALELAAKTRELAWSFRVSRGNVASELLKSATEADLVSLGKGAFPLTRRSRLGSTARMVTRGARHTFVVAGETGLSRQQVAADKITVTFDGSQSGRAALGIAARIAQAKDRSLAVLLLADENRSAELETQATDILKGLGVKAPTISFQTLIAADEECLCYTLDDRGGGLVVVGGNCAAVAAASIERLLESTNRSVLLVK